MRESVVLSEWPGIVERPEETVQQGCKKTSTGHGSHRHACGASIGSGPTSKIGPKLCLLFVSFNRVRNADDLII